MHYEDDFFLLKIEYDPGIEGSSIRRQNLNDYIGTLHQARTQFYHHLVPIVKQDF